MKRVPQFVRSLILLLCSTCCGGCLSTALIQNASHTEHLYAQAGFIDDAGNLLLELRDSNQQADGPRYLVIDYKDLAPLLPTSVPPSSESPPPEIALPRSIPYKLVSIQRGQSEDIATHHMLLSIAYSSRIEFQYDRDLKKRALLYVYGHQRALITQDGLLGNSIDQTVRSVPGTIACCVLIVPAFAIDVIASPIEAFWVVFIAVPDSFNPHHR